MRIKFANIFLNKLGAAEASSVMGCCERPSEMQQQRVNTPPVLFDGAVSLKDPCYTGYVVGWLAHEITRLFQPELAAGVCCNDPAFNISWPGVPALINARDAAYPDFVS